MLFGCKFFCVFPASFGWTNKQTHWFVYRARCCKKALNILLSRSLSRVFFLVFRGYHFFALKCFFPCFQRLYFFLITMRRTLLAVCITLFFGCEKTLVQDLNKCEDFCLQSCPYTQASSWELFFVCIMCKSVCWVCVSVKYGNTQQCASVVESSKH